LSLHTPFNFNEPLTVLPDASGKRKQKTEKQDNKASNRGGCYFVATDMAMLHPTSQALRSVALLYAIWHFL